MMISELKKKGKNKRKLKGTERRKMDKSNIKKKENKFR